MFYVCCDMVVRNDARKKTKKINKLTERFERLIKLLLFEFFRELLVFVCDYPFNSVLTLPF